MFCRSKSGNSQIDDAGGGGGELPPGQVPVTVSDVKLVNAFFKGRKTPDQVKTEDSKL